MKKKISLIVIAIIFIALSYLCTYWYDSIKGNEGREFFVILFGIMTGIGGLLLLFLSIINLFSKKGEEMF